MPIVWFIYPEVSGRSLEEVNLLFTSDSLFVGPNMKEYHRLVDEAGGNFAVAERGLLDSVDEKKGEVDARTMSYTSGMYAKASMSYTAGEGQIVSHTDEKSAMSSGEAASKEA